MNAAAQAKDNAVRPAEKAGPFSRRPIVEGISRRRALIRPAGSIAELIACQGRGKGST